MKIALLGKGKTGKKVLDQQIHQIEVFDTKNTPTLEKLKNADIILSFLPGEAFKTYIPLLIDSQLPVVTGSTGFKWPENIDTILKNKNLSWIYASNFSLGIAIVKQMLNHLAMARKIFPHHQTSIHEIHHTQKVDAPSGTALSLQEWMDEECVITYERKDDVIGYHELTFDTGTEKITLTHTAQDRKLFSEGALWAAEYLYHHPNPGLHSFQDIVKRIL